MVKKRITKRKKERRMKSRRKRKRERERRSMLDSEMRIISIIRSKTIKEKRLRVM